MSLSRRGKNRRYYYRSVRVGGRVTSRYVGHGSIAEVEAGLAEHRQFRRRQQTWTRQQVGAANQLLLAFRRRLQMMTDANLYSSGHHRPVGGQWRKFRRIRRVATTPTA